MENRVARILRDHYADFAPTLAAAPKFQQHLTLQDRLVKELRIADISSIVAANALMPTFLEAYNRKFAKIPRNTYDAHRPVRADDDLDLILAWRELRKVNQNLLLHYEGQLYVLVDRKWTFESGSTKLPGFVRRAPPAGVRMLRALSFRATRNKAMLRYAQGHALVGGR